MCSKRRQITGTEISPCASCEQLFLGLATKSSVFIEFVSLKLTTTTRLVRKVPVSGIFSFSPTGLRRRKKKEFVRSVLLKKIILSTVGQFGKLSPSLNDRKKLDSSFSLSYSGGIERRVSLLQIL